MFSGARNIMRECVEHFTDGRDAWKIGIVGFFTRLRGILTTILLSVTTSGVPFWWSLIPKTIELRTSIFFIVISISAATVVFIIFLYIRRGRQKHLDTSFFLHQLAHFLRDYQTKTYERMVGENEPYDERERFYTYIASICDLVKDCFRRYLSSFTVEVAIRLAVESVETAGEKRVMYVTMGRSSGLSSERSKTTENIGANEGIARFLIEKKESHGVLIYNDLVKADATDTFKMTANEKKYPCEICTMMVAPLNAWDGKAQSMTGILYVTSRRKNVFKFEHVDMMRFVADTVASGITCVIEKLKTVNRMPEFVLRKGGR